MEWTIINHCDFPEPLKKSIRLSTLSLRRFNVNTSNIIGINSFQSLDYERALCAAVYHDNLQLFDQILAKDKVKITRRVHIFIVKKNERGWKFVKSVMKNNTDSQFVEIFLMALFAYGTVEEYEEMTKVNHRICGYFDETNVLQPMTFNFQKSKYPHALDAIRNITALYHNQPLLDHVLESSPINVNLVKFMIAVGDWERVNGKCIPDGEIVMKNKEQVIKYCQSCQKAPRFKMKIAENQRLDRTKQYTAIYENIILITNEEDLDWFMAQLSQGDERFYYYCSILGESLRYPWLYLHAYRKIRE